MNLTVLVWLVMFVLLLGASFVRPVYGTALYLLTYFALPDYWWWGTDIKGNRWTLIGGLCLLTAVVLNRPRVPLAQCSARKRTTKIALWMAVNFTVVQFVIAQADKTVDDYFLDMKFVLLFFLIVSSVRDSKDLSVLVWSLVIGIGYLGFEVTINKRGKMTHGRLEGIGIPGAAAANDLGSLIVTLLPLAAGLVLVGRGVARRAFAAAIGGLAFNIILLVNSRGAFISMLASGASMLAVATGKDRKLALKAVALAGIACAVFLGDPKIIERFQTTFVGEEERDESAASRIQFWQAGGLMIRDYPFGAGAEAFKKNGGPRYLRVVGVELDRAVHNGFINDAIQWGIQGILLRLALYFSAIVGLYRCNVTGYVPWLWSERFFGICMITGMVGLLTGSMFGNFIDREWSWLIIATATAMSQVASNKEAEDKAALALAGSGGL